MQVAQDLEQKIQAYRHQDAVLLSAEHFYSWTGRPDSRIEETIYKGLDEKLRQKGIVQDENSLFMLSVQEAARNLFEFASDRDCCFDAYIDGGRFVLITSSTGIDYTENMLAALSRRIDMTKDVKDAYEGGQGTIFQMASASRIGFIHDYKSPNKDFSKVQTAFYLEMPVDVDF